MKYVLLSTVVAPRFATSLIRIRALGKEEFLGLLPKVDTNFCGHPVTSKVLKGAYPDLPEPVRGFWDGEGKALAARPKGGVRGSSKEGDTEVTLDDLEFVIFSYSEGE